MRFFFIREEVIPIAMIFCESDGIEKEDLPIPKGEDWYLRLLATPNRVFGEQVLVAVGMSDKWLARNKEMHVLMFNGEVDELYQSAFPTLVELWACDLWEMVFATPPTAIEGAYLPKPRLLPGVTSAVKEIVYLSSEESVGSSNHELSSCFEIFAGVLRDLGIDPEENKTNKEGGGGRTIAEIPKKGTLRFCQSNLEDYVVATDSLEGLLHIGEKQQSSAAATSKSSESAGSRAPDSCATPSSTHEKEEEEVEEEVE
ncbi:hypothetical protein Hanom_Chr04g00331841 [Helianthus anomalus]